MSIIIDTLNCGSGTIGTWIDGCNVSIKDIKKPFFIKKNVKISLKDDVFDEEKRAELIKSGQLVPLNDLLNTTEAGAKNNVQTFANKIKKTVSQGLYEFGFELEENECLLKELHKIAAQKGWALLLLDSEDKLFFDSKNDNLNGFSISDISVNNVTFNDGGSKISMITVDVQLDQDGTAGFNKRRSFLVDETLIDLKGIQSVTLKTTDAPAATSVKINVTGSCDNSTVVLGIATTNVRVRKASDNTVVAGTKTYNATTGEYNIAGLTAATDYLIDLFDTTGGTPVVDTLNEAFYKSNVLEVSTIAS